MSEQDSGHLPYEVVNKEIEQFIQENRRTVLFVKCNDGLPRGWPLFRFYRPGTLFFTTYKKSAKVRHLQAASSATAVLLTDNHIEPVRYAVFSGAIRVRDITDELADMILQSSQPRSDRFSEQKKGFRKQLLSGKRVLVELDIEQSQLF